MKLLLYIVLPVAMAFFGPGVFGGFIGPTAGGGSGTPVLNGDGDPVLNGDGDQVYVAGT